jgi:hypothetical protein
VAWTIEEEIAMELGIEPGGLWSKIDDMIVAHFEMQGASVGER